MITISNLEKRFGKKIAIDKVSLQLERGKIYLLIGSNGSGKSTLLKSIIGLIRTNSGFIRKDTPSLRFGYSPEQIDIPDDYSGNYYLDFLMPTISGERGNSVDLLINLFDMGPYLSNKIRSYSNGMKKKNGLLLAFYGDPNIVILDEPFEGLDTIDRDKLINFIKNYKSVGRTVIISTHILFELDLYVDKAFYIKNGSIVADFHPASNAINYYSNDTSNVHIEKNTHNATEKLSLTEIYRSIYK